ncbi:MAG: LLM class flavin-dependent oxidoreductase [Actinomycetota bacterium]|nr:LLM class flavin-dependent oxidoreductase [Actinomycetota bacterium]
MNEPRTVRLSVLDLSVLNDGQSSADALQTTAALAQRADQLGYTRFWVAEHHNMPSVACTAPTVLMAHLAALTSTIRVGSGGVMLPNHAPLVVAEQFALLEALHPGRIDVGIGRAPGTDQRTAMALRRTDVLDVDDFPRDFLDMMGLLGDPRLPSGLWQHFQATPAATTYPAVFLLGSSGYSAQLAGQLGLPFAFAHHFDTGGTLQAVELYRQHFRPSVALSEPHLIITANVLAADTREEADWHAAPGRLTALGRRTGRFIRLPAPHDAAVHPDLPEANRLPTSRVVGDISTVVGELRGLAERTGADEMMVTSVAYDLSARVHSLELLAQHWENRHQDTGRSGPAATA